MPDNVTIDDLHEELAKVAPITGVYMKDYNDRTKWGCHYVESKKPDPLIKSKIDTIINNITYVSETQDQINRASRRALTSQDWMVLKAFEQSLLAAAKNKSKDVIEKLLADAAFMQLLADREAKRQAVVAQYTLP